MSREIERIGQGQKYATTCGLSPRRGGVQAGKFIYTISGSKSNLRTLELVSTFSQEVHSQLDLFGAIVELASKRLS